VRLWKDTLVKVPCLRESAGREPSLLHFSGTRLTTEEKSRNISVNIAERCLAEQR